MQKLLSVRNKTQKYLTVTKKFNRVRAGALFFSLAFTLMLGLAVYQVIGNTETASADPTVNEYLLPQYTYPTSITEGSDGALWFTEYLGGVIGRITPSGTITTYPIPTRNADPQGITSGSDGALWFTESGTNKIGRLTTSGVFTEYSLPGTSATSSPYDITTGSNGSLWFTVSPNSIGQITTSGVITEYTLPESNSGPDGITAGPDGALWFTENLGNRIGRITTSGTITEYTLPESNSGPDGITAGPDGALWFTENLGNRIGRITTSGTITEYSLPASSSDLQGITAGPDGALWFSEEAYPGKIGRITTSGNITEYPLPTGDGGSLGITAGPNNTLWFAQYNGGYIGSITDNVSQVAPTNLTATTPTTSSPALTWTGSAGADSYNIYRNGAIIGSSTSPTYTDTTAPQGSSSYYVTAVYSGTATAPSNTINVVYDTTPPTITYSLSPTPNSAGWNNSPVTVTFTCNDVIVGIASCSSPQTLSNNGASQTVTGRATNNAGSTASVTATVNIDKSAPTISAVASPSPNAGGWNNSPVTITYTCSNALSGIATCPSPITVAVDGANQQFTGTATSNADNTASVTTTINLDQTLPTTGAPTWSSNPVLIGDNSTLTVPANDALSGVVGGEYYIGNTDPGQGNGTAMNWDGTNLTANIGANLNPGTYTINARAEDAAGNWGSTTQTTLTVRSVAAPTGLSAPTPTNQVPSLTWTADPDAAYYNIYRNGTDIGSSTAASFTDTTAPQGNNSYSVTAVALDGYESLPSSTVSVVYDTTPPTITYSLSPTPNSAGWNNSPVTVTFTCNDVIVGIATCTQSQTLSTDGTSQTVTGTATNNAGTTAAVTVTVNLDQTPPTLGTSTWTANPLTQGQVTNLTVPANDALSGVVGGEYYIGNTDPGQGNGTAMTYDGTNLDASLGSNLAPGSYTINARAEDAAGNWSPVTQATLVVVSATTAPTITSSSTASTGMNVPFSFTVTTTGTPTAALSESGALPAGITFTDNGDGTATISGLAAAGTNGTYPITITANNSTNPEATQSFILTVTTATAAPNILSANSDTETYGIAFSFIVQASGYPIPTLKKTGTLPAGVKFTDNSDGTATIAGTPSASAAGVYTITITAKNSLGTTTQTFTETIVKSPVFKGVPGKSLTATVGSSYSLTVTVSAYETASLSETGALPNGLTFTDNGNNTATISGIPSTGDGGTYAITINAANSNGSSSKTITLKVDEGPSITSANNATAIPGSKFSFNVTATGYPAPKYSLTGTLPTGINFNDNTGTFSGKPKLTDTIGAYPLTITVTNSTGSVSQSFNLMLL